MVSHSRAFSYFLLFGHILLNFLPKEISQFWIIVINLFPNTIEEVMIILLTLQFTIAKIWNVKNFLLVLIGESDCVQKKVKKVSVSRQI